MYRLLIPIPEIHVVVNLIMGRTHFLITVIIIIIYCVHVTNLLKSDYNQKSHHKRHILHKLLCIIYCYMTECDTTVFCLNFFMSCMSECIRVTRGLFLVFKPSVNFFLRKS